MSFTAVCCCFLCLLQFGGSAFAQGVPGLEGKLKAVFLYHFLQYVRWPETEQEGPLRVVLAGDTPIETHLRQIAQSRDVGGRKIEVVQSLSSEDWEVCHILFVPDANWSEFEAAASHFLRLPVLVVSDTTSDGEYLPSFRFFIEGDRLHIEANRDVLKSQGLKVSSQLMKLTHSEGGKR